MKKLGTLAKSCISFLWNVLYNSCKMTKGVSTWQNDGSNSMIST